MRHQCPIIVLRDGPKLTDTLYHDDVARWSLFASGQAISFDPIKVPQALNNLDLVEPLGGNLLTLLLRPTMKQMDSEHCSSSMEGRRKMLDELLNFAKPTESVLYHATKARDLFGLCAVDYAPELSVLGGRPPEQSVSENQQTNDKRRRILNSLVRREMIKTDLFSDLVYARRSLSVELYPGICTKDPAELRKNLLTYFDLLNKHFRQTQRERPAFSDNKDLFLNTQFSLG